MISGKHERANFFNTLALLLTLTAAHESCKFPAIFNFGDSNSDTGGYSASIRSTPWPNGETYFGEPAGRVCDGRLLLDFMAESLKLPYLSPYLNSVGSNFTTGANFATSGSSIRQPNINWYQNGYSPFSLDLQLGQFNEFKSKSKKFHDLGGVFKELLPSDEIFSKALYTFDIGQNDLTLGLFYNKSGDEVKTSIPEILNAFSDVVKKVYSQGGRYFWIHNTGPLGCLPYVLERLPVREGDLDSAGCATPYNQVARYYNQVLEKALVQLQEELPLATFTYVDLFSAKYALITNFKIHGFKHSLWACCGNGSEYNFNPHIYCGTSVEINGTQVLLTPPCKDPHKSIIWDGTHYTEAANYLIFSQIVNGDYSNPPRPLDMACVKSFPKNMNLIDMNIKCEV